MKKLHGAAAKAHAKRMAKLHRRRMRKNPGGLGSATISQRQIAERYARMRAYQYKKKMAAKGKPITGRGAKLHLRHTAKKFLTQTERALRRRRRRGLPAPQGLLYSGLKRKRKSRGTTVAAKPARKRRTSMAKHRKSPKRVAAGKKAARTRKRRMTAGRTTRKVRRRRSAAKTVRRVTRRRVRRVNWLGRYQKALHSRRPKRATARKLRAARITILRARSGKFRKMRTWAKSYARRYRMTTNPSAVFSGIKNAMKQALPVAAGYLGSRIAAASLANVLQARVSALAGRKIETGVSVGVLAGLHIATSKVAFLRKHRTGIMIGAGLNALTTAIKEYAPDSVKAFLAMGASDGVYDQALQGYEDVGDYVETEGYEDIGDYVATEDYVETEGDDGLGAYEEVGSACGAYEDLGAVRPRRMLKGAPRRSFLSRAGGQMGRRAIPRSSGVKQIPEWSDEPLESFYTGIFAGGYGN